MIKYLLNICLIIFLLPSAGFGQPCQIAQVSATPLPCNDYSFLVSVNLSVTNPSSPGFTLAGNGVIYGTYLYSDLPVTVGPLYGDNQSHYEFIAWDVENPSCQNFISFTAANCGPIPSFTNFTMDSITCITSSIAAVTINFNHANTSSNTFDLRNKNGALLGSWLYASLPVDITNFVVNGAAPITVKVCDHDNQASCKTFVVDAIDCTPNNCEIFNVTADPECVNGNFVVHLDFETDNPASDSFTVHGNSLNYGKFAYSDLPVVLGPLNGNSNLNWDFIIQDKVLPSCTAEKVLGMYHCPPPCDILNLEAMALECDGNDAYSLRVNMEIEGKGDTGYSIFSNDYFYGSHAYSDLPLTIPNFAVGNFVDQVTVCDNDNPGCCATQPFEALLCNGCIIYNLVANPLPCNNQGQFYITIDFDFQNVSTEGFSISGNGQNYGNFSYDQVPVTLGPFPGDGSQYLEFVVTDLVNDLCFDAVEIGTLPCNAICSLTNLQVDTGACTGNNLYILHVNFDHSGTTGVGFDLYANGTFYNNYPYTALPLTLLEFPSSGTGHDTIRVCDQDNGNCCATLGFTSPDCHCSIYEATTETLSCTSDSTFAVSVEFFYQNLPGNSVDVFIDGIFIGTHNIDVIPFVVDNVPEGSGSAVLTICGHEAADCCEDVLIQLMNCVGPQCSIYGLGAVAGDCNSDTTYALDLLFNHMNLPTDSVNIWANDQFIGKYLVQPEFIHIEHFPVLNSPNTLLTVCAVGNNDCCDTFTFPTPDCTPGGCAITDLVALPGDCHSDSTYSLVIDYTAENISGDSVVLTANGNIIDTFLDPGHHIVIENFPWHDGVEDTLTLCSLSSPDCCDSYSYPIPNCNGGNQCSITVNFVEIGDCLSDSTYTLVLDFQFANLPTDSVAITADETYIGTFQVNEGHLTIQNFPVFPGQQTVVHVCAAGAPDCCGMVSFDTPNCAGGNVCNISDLITHIGDCQSDTTFVLIVDFQFSNLPTDSVVITANEVTIGTFQVHEGHLVIGQFPIFPDSTTLLHVCAVGAPDCCADYSFETPNCNGGGTCHIYDLFAEPGPCTSDSTYQLDIILYWNNLPTDSVLIYANDHFIGTYHTDPDYIRIENFPVLSGETTNLVICALGAPQCCGNYSFNTPVCNGGTECLIYNVSVQTADCNSDSTFGVVINFQYQNISAGGFDVYTGDHYLGFFTFEQIPIQTSEFPANSSGSYVVTICESDTTSCCTSYEFEGPVCAPGSCDIHDLTYSVSSCDSAGNFFFILNFQYQNVGASGFNVVGNSNEYGNFSYDQLPIQIGPFPTNNTSYEFLVTDAENPACFDFIEPGMVNCTVATNEVDRDEIFQVFNNGSSPGILAKKNISFILFNSNGKMIMHNNTINAGSFYELNRLPNGFYIATIIYQGNTWPVKLVKAGN